MAVWFTENNSRNIVPKWRMVRVGYDYRDPYWHVLFREDGAANTLPLRLRFVDPSKLLEMQVRWGAVRTADAVHVTESNIRKRQGGNFMLRLDEEQYRKLLK